ncbi:8925_t:CDS:2 [Entrophospora sp. SA101]|nr:8925_t:CDS:2 [Entrophospora sp. SA101]
MLTTNNVNYLYKILSTKHELPPSISSPTPSLISSLSNYTLPLTQLDIDDGFIHLSTARQVLTVANLFFKNEKEITLKLKKPNENEDFLLDDDDNDWLED